MFMERLKNFYFSFPIQLLVLHVKRNHLLLVFWVLLFALTGGWIGRSFGVKGLILSPEYLNISGFLAFIIVGLSVGGFIMGFNLYSYILHGSRFRFIATVRKPFLVFSYNNLIIPLSYLVFYTLLSYRHQTSLELIDPGDALLNLMAFHLGVGVFVLFSFVYFIFTNINLFYLRKKHKKGAFNAALHRKEPWSKMQKSVRSWKVNHYLYPVFRFRIARNVKHYRAEWIDEILEQNHINAGIFEMVAISSFFLVGALGSTSNFLIPAAASIFLFFTIVLMLISAFFSWLKGWTMTLIIGLLILVNLLSTNFDFLSVKSQALGIDYANESCVYSSEYLENLHDLSNVEWDKESAYTLLNNRLIAQGISEDSVLILVNVSGGGMRSTAWAFATLMWLDSLTNGEVFKHTALIAGSSGGMIGAAYWRELSYKRANHLDSTAFIGHFRLLTSDLLNPIIFTMVSNDFSFRFRKSRYRGTIYKHDRAFAFEKQLNINTNGWFDIPIMHYRDLEFQGQIPMMILSPTILNDGRRMLISPQPISYLSINDSSSIPGWKPLTENVEFRRLFVNQNADSLRFLSALRMNATFPYILPAVTLPSDPEIEVMDAGIRDNYGLETSFQFLNSLDTWFKHNIKKVVILQIRDKSKSFEPKAIVPSVFNRLKSPIGNIYGNFGRVQEYNQDQMFQNARNLLGIEIQWVNFELLQNDEQAISLSFHLSELEKQQILKALDREVNKKAMLALKQLF